MDGPDAVRWGERRRAPRMISLGAALVVLAPMLALVRDAIERGGTHPPSLQIASPVAGWRVHSAGTWSSVGQGSSSARPRPTADASAVVSAIVAGRQTAPRAPAVGVSFSTDEQIAELSIGELAAVALDCSDAWQAAPLVQEIRTRVEARRATREDRDAIAAAIAAAPAANGLVAAALSPPHLAIGVAGDPAGSPIGAILTDSDPTVSASIDAAGRAFTPYSLAMALDAIDEGPPQATWTSVVEAGDRLVVASSSAPASWHRSDQPTVVTRIVSIRINGKAIRGTLEVRGSRGLFGGSGSGPKPRVPLRVEIPAPTEPGEHSIEVDVDRVVNPRASWHDMHYLEHADPRRHGHDDRNPAGVDRRRFTGTFRVVAPSARQASGESASEAGSERTSAPDGR